MKVCVRCGASYPAVSVVCTACGSAPNERDGFASFAPKLTETENGFKAEYYGNYAHLESSHFWFRARSQLIVWALRKYCPDLQSFFEVGCGTGYVLERIASAFPTAQLRGSEMLTTGLRFAAARLPAVEFIQMDAREIPFIDEFDAIGAFDVLEHIDDDRRVLAQMRMALKMDGVMLLTVPQHAWLWSKVDEHSCHVRRYSAGELHAKVEQSGFTILRSTSFVSSLLPTMILSRALRKKSVSKRTSTAELRLPSMVNNLFHFLMQLDLLFIMTGGTLPAGGSRFVVAKKS